MSSDISLSKLSRGKGEKVGQNIQVVYDDKDLTERYYAHFYRKHDDHFSRNNHICTKSHSLPKTYLTKKGPLLLFSEDSIIEPDFFPLNDRTVQLESSDLKTTRHLRKSILEFGSRQITTVNRTYPIKEYHEEEIYTKVTFERQNTLDSFTFFKEHKLNYSNLNEEFQFDKIRPGYSAKRYLSNLTRHLEPSVLSKLTLQGRIREENMFETSESQPTMRQRIDDDLSRVPPAYRIQRQWMTFNILPLKGYRFFRTKSEFFGKVEADGKTKENTMIASEEKIQVVDKDGNDINYEKLNKTDKEIVLTELLLQTALQSIAEKRIEAMGNLVKAGKKREEALQLLDAKLTIKKLNPEMIQSDNSTNAYLFQKVRGNKLVSLKSQQPLQPAPQPAAAFKPTQVNVDPVAPPSPTIQANTSQTTTTKSTLKVADNTLVDSTFINSFSCTSYRTDANPDEKENQKSDEKIALSAIRKLNDKLGKKRMEMSAAEMNTSDRKIDDASQAKKSINVKENLKDIKVQRVYGTRSPTRLRLENTLPKKQEKENQSQVFLKNYLASTANKTGTKPEATEKTGSSKGVFIVGPDGEISSVGYTLSDEQVTVLKEKQTRSNQESVVYKLEPEVPPYLYYSKKLDDNVNINYGNMLDKPFEMLDPLNKKELTKLLDMNGTNLNFNEDSVEEPVLNRQILQSLANHAQQIAKCALEAQGSGTNLVSDVKLALYENFNNIQNAFKMGEIDVKDFDNYTNLMKEALKDSLSKLFAQSKDFKDVEIDDDLLGNILEYPTKAFEIRTDRDKKKLRVKPTFTAQNLRDWDDETDLKLKGKLQPNMKKEKFPIESEKEKEPEVGSLMLNGEIKKFSFLKRKSKPVWAFKVVKKLKRRDEDSGKTDEEDIDLIQEKNIDSDNEEETQEGEEKKLTRMWNILASQNTDEEEVKKVISHREDSANLLQERPTLLNELSTNLKSNLSIISSVGTADSVDSKTGLKKPKKPKLSERDKRAMAKMNKMREDAEKEAKMQKDKASGKVEEVLEQKKVNFVKEVTLSKIKEEISEAEDQNGKANSRNNKLDKNVKKPKNTKADKDGKKPEIKRSTAIKKLSSGDKLDKKSVEHSESEDTNNGMAENTIVDEQVTIENPTHTKPNSKNKLAKIKSKNWDKKHLDKLMEENQEIGEAGIVEKADEKLDDEELDGEIVVKMIKRKPALKNLPIDDGGLNEESHTVSMVSPTITLGTSTIMMDDEMYDARQSSVSGNLVDPEKARELKKLKQAEQKKMEALKRRQEKEEEKRKLDEENMKQEQLNKQIQDELAKKEEQRRQLHLQELEKRKAIEEALLEKERQKQEKIEKEKKRIADKEARMAQMKIDFINEMNAKAKQEEEEKEKQEFNKIAEAQKILEMNLRQQAEYLRVKEEEEEAERIRMENYRLEHAGELESALSEAKRLAEEEARRKAEIEIRMRFITACRDEEAQMRRSQAISRAFVFSYYDLLSFLSRKENAVHNAKRK